MAYLSRVTDFTPSTLIQSSQVDAEFDQLVEVLNGSDTATQIRLIHAAGTVALEVDNTGGGIVQTWKVAGAAKAHINASGQFESDIVTGTPPMVIDSTTGVANLNADTVDAVHGTSILRNDIETNTWNGTNPYLQIYGSVSSSIEMDDTGEGGNSRFRIKNEAGTVRFQVYRDGGPFWVDLLRIDLTLETFTDGSDNEFATATSVTSYKTTWSYGVFYAGAIDTSITQAIWIMPDSISFMRGLEANYVYQNGTPTGTSQIKIEMKDSTGNVLKTETVSLLIGDVIGNTYQLIFGSTWQPTAADYIQFTVLQDGGHRDISIHVQGTQTLIDP